MQSLGHVIAIMSELRELDCREDDADALESVLRHVALSSSLLSLKVTIRHLPPNVDLSLSDCIRQHNAIVDYTLRCSTYAFEEGILVPKQQHAIPTFIEALKQTIRFRRLYVSVFTMMMMTTRGTLTAEPRLSLSFA